MTSTATLVQASATERVNKRFKRNNSYMIKPKIGQVPRSSLNRILDVGFGFSTALFVVCMPLLRVDMSFAKSFDFDVRELTGRRSFDDAVENAEKEFQSSDLLKELKKRTEENREKNKREIEAKYCIRQAELGIGDCGDLSEVPDVLEELKNFGSP